MKKHLIIILSLVSASAFANPLADQALKFVPGGTVAQQKIKEVKIKTPLSSIVEIEFHSDGTFEEASGDNIEKDILTPGNGLVTLKTAVAELVKQGKGPTGDWSLEKSFFKGWHYEFEGYENGQKFDYIVDAKTGKLLESKVDD
jgi:uncharacterized membrane protein YkoI